MKLSILLFVAAGLLAQNTAKFPAATPTTAQMGVASNRSATTLTAPINSSVTSIPVLSSTGFKAGSFVTIDNEQLAVCSIPDGSHLNVGVSACPNVDGRGVDTANGAGAAASHLVNAAVQARVVAWHVNQTEAEINAIAAYLRDSHASVIEYGAKGDGSTDDSSAFSTALATGNSIYVAGGRTYLIGSALTMTTSGQGLYCGPGAVLKVKSPFASNFLTLSGMTGGSVRGCTFDGNSTSVSALIEVSGSNDIALSDNLFKNTTGTNYAMRADNVSDFLVRGNTCVATIGGCLSAFNGSGGSARISVVNNTANNSTGAGAFSFVDGPGSGDMRDVAVTGNTAIVKYGFCYGFGSFSGAGAAYSATFAGNQCTIANASGSTSCDAETGTSAACGGWTISTASDVVVSANSYYAVGQQVAIAGIEVVQCTDCTISDNIIHGDSGTTVGSNGISANCLRCSITGNRVMSYGNLSTSAITLHNLSTFLDVSDTVIANNLVIMPAGSGQSAIDINCHANMGTANRISVIGNNVVGNPSATAVLLDNNTGGCTQDRMIVIGNHFNNFTNGVFADNVTNILMANNTYTSITTRYNDGGGNSIAPGLFPGSVSVGKITDPTVTMDISGTMNVSGLTQLTGGSYLTSGVTVGATTNAVQGLDVKTTSAFTGKMCLSGSTSCNSGSADSPTFEQDQGTNRFNFKAIGTGRISNPEWQYNAVDAGGINFGSGSQSWLYMDFKGVQLFSNNLATINGQLPANGSIIYCTDCKNVVDDGATAGQTCANSGHGAILRREAGHNLCN